MIYIIIGCIAMILLVLWIVSVQKAIRILEEHVQLSMTQLDIQITSLKEAWLTLVALIKKDSNRDDQQIVPIVEMNPLLQSHITLDKIKEQLSHIEETKTYIYGYANAHPDIQSDPLYLNTIIGIEHLDKMLCTSQLIYNDSVAKYNKAIGIFPLSLLLHGIGFSKRTYLN